MRDCARRTGQLLTFLSFLPAQRVCATRFSRNFVNSDLSTITRSSPVDVQSLRMAQKSAAAGVGDWLYESSCAPRSSTREKPYKADGLAKRKSVNRKSPFCISDNYLCCARTKIPNMLLPTSIIRAYSKGCHTRPINRELPLFQIVTRLFTPVSSHSQAAASWHRLLTKSRIIISRAPPSSTQNSTRH